MPSRLPALWLDADSGNEMDDLYALFRVLMEPGLAIAGLSSVHFNNADLVAFEHWNQYPTAGIDTVGISQSLHEALLAALGRADLPHPRGADRQMGRAWGGRQPRDCPAARALIAAAHAQSPDTKLLVLGLGAVTNLASALALDPAIADRLSIHLLAGDHDPATGAWNKNEFNVRNDLNGFDFLLDHPTLELAIMPISTARRYVYNKVETLNALSEDVPAEKMLRDRWQETNPQDQTRVLWDLALVQAVLRPELARLAPARTPPENTAREIRLYREIDVAGMRADFFRQLAAGGGSGGGRAGGRGGP
jgi:inosine-uridine nucleoside N-ribohydrolase